MYISSKVICAPLLLYKRWGDRMMSQPDNGPWPARTAPRRTFEAYDGETLVAYGDEVGIHYLDGRGPVRVVELLHEHGGNLLNAPVPQADGVGITIGRVERYDGAR